MDSERPESSPHRVIITRAALKSPVLDVSLVLASQGVRHWIEYDPGTFQSENERAVPANDDSGFVLTVDPADAARARDVLDKHTRENEGYRVEDPEVAPFGLFFSPLLHLAIPALFSFWAASVPWQVWMERRGGAAADLILNGELWRTLTATTLHADSEHFLGNMLSGFFILNLLRRRAGPGTTMPILTLCAALTNFAVAALSPADHFSIGFSTVVFAALGLLAGLETLLLPRGQERREAGLRGISPLLAAFFLAVMTGLGENADIQAHFIGFAAGVLASPAVYWIRKTSWEKWGWQVLGVLATFGVYGAAWWLALR